MSQRRNPNAGLFAGWWFDTNGHKIRRLRRDEYGPIYGLWKRHTDIRCGLNTVGSPAPWTHR